MVFSEFTDLGGRIVPAVMEMQPADKPNEHTKVIYETLEDKYRAVARLAAKDFREGRPVMAGTLKVEHNR